jgi:hypothetical protein
MKQNMTAIFIKTLPITEPFIAIFMHTFDNTFRSMYTAVSASMRWQIIEIIGFNFTLDTYR